MGPEQREGGLSTSWDWASLEPCRSGIKSWGERVLLKVAVTLFLPGQVPKGDQGLPALSLGVEETRGPCGIGDYCPLHSAESEGQGLIRALGRSPALHGPQFPHEYHTREFRLV